MVIGMMPIVGKKKALLIIGRDVGDIEGIKKLGSAFSRIPEAFMPYLTGCEEVAILYLEGEYPRVEKGDKYLDESDGSQFMEDVKAALKSMGVDSDSFEGVQIKRHF